MKIKLLLDPNDPIRADLLKSGIEDDPESEYILIRKGVGVNYIAGKREDQQFYLDISDVCFIESMGHDILIHTSDGTYNSGDRLKALEQVLPADRFLRVSSSAIVNLKMIRRIESTLMQKLLRSIIPGWMAAGGTCF